MKSFITHISATAFLLHMILGCCAHHAHAAETACATVADHAHCHAGHPADGHHEHGEEATAEPDTESPSHAPHHDCDEDECVFVAVGKTAVVHSDASDILPSLFSPPSDQCASGSAWAAVSDWGERIALPVRAHLWNQVLLI